MIRHVSVHCAGAYKQHNYDQCCGAGQFFIGSGYFIAGSGSSSYKKI